MAKNFIVRTSATKTHEGCRYTPFTLEIHVEHAFFKDTKVLFQSILHSCHKIVVAVHCSELGTYTMEIIVILQAAMLYVCLFFTPKTLQSETAIMREIVDRVSNSTIPIFCLSSKCVPF